MTNIASLSASAPTRLDFGGGWTDVPPFPEERGGFVCNIAIERRATVTLRQLKPGEPLPQSALADAACRQAGLENVHITIDSDFPVGAGLGGSSAAGVALAAAIAAWQERSLSPQQLAEWSRAVEVQQLGVAGGRQDHYAAAFGGALALEFAHDVGVSPIPLSPETVSALESRCIVVYTGESRISGTTIRGVLDGYANGRPEIVLALDRMAALARLMSTALAHGYIDSLGALVGEHWTHQRALHPGITTDRIDALISGALSVGALGGKPLGASGGGCVLLIAPQNRIDDVRNAAQGLGTLLDFRIASQGVSLFR